MYSRMMLNTFGTHELQTRTFCTEVSDRFFFMLVAGDVMTKVSLHIFNGEGFVHGTEVLL